MLEAWDKKWARIFLIGFLGIIFLVTAVDILFAEFEAIRTVDLLLFGGYVVFWLLLYWTRPDFFRH